MIFEFGTAWYSVKPVIGTFILVFEKMQEIHSDLPPGYSRWHQDFSHDILSAENFEVFKWLEEGRIPIGYGVVISLEMNVADIMFARFPKQKNDVWDDEL